MLKFYNKKGTIMKKYRILVGIIMYIIIIIIELQAC